MGQGAGLRKLQVVTGSLFDLEVSGPRGDGRGIYRSWGEEGGGAFALEVRESE